MRYKGENTEGGLCTTRGRRKGKGVVTIFLKGKNKTVVEVLQENGNNSSKEYMKGYKRRV